MSNSDISAKINSFLTELNFSPEKTYFENTAFFLGWSICNSKFRLVYRMESDALLICSLHNKCPGTGLESTLIYTLNLWRDLLDQIPELLCLKAIISQLGSDYDLSNRKRMTSFLLERGGVLVESDNMTCIEFRR